MMINEVLVINLIHIWKEFFTYSHIWYP